MAEHPFGVGRPGFGKVARGGLRWSDRAQDYRTEVLGLVKGLMEISPTMRGAVLHMVELVVGV